MKYEERKKFIGISCAEKYANAIKKSYPSDLEEKACFR